MDVRLTAEISIPVEIPLWKFTVCEKIMAYGNYIILVRMGIVTFTMVCYNLGKHREWTNCNLDKLTAI